MRENDLRSRKVWRKSPRRDNSVDRKILEVKFKAENQSQKTVDYWMGAGRAEPDGSTG